ncbi:flowering time control protein FPA-like [Salvia hispanica]|uniref:flowering time control protein FPA-like n=1 Tax=Salvia hispanica TaxID=49212 RepID=UPI002009B9F9|nr:flowering time control protein FPA-like [Salvia hispanica]
MSFREVRGRPRRDYPSRSEDRSYHRRESNPPSRHLWVGNLPHNLTESDVAHLFLHFGELESIAVQPGRSYAFINYISKEDAYDAFKELQGFDIEGNPLRLEYAKALSKLGLLHCRRFKNAHMETRIIAQSVPSHSCTSVTI